MKHKVLDEIVGKSKQIKQIKTMIVKIAGHTHMPVMITGETGTGKELVANALHQCSDRAGNEMVRINCSAIPGELLESTLFGHKKGAFTSATEDSIGLVEAAKDSTLFLDEISEMDVRLQPKLLRFLENGTYRRLGEVKERKVDVWVLTATNRDLDAELQQGKFRPDLYYRLKGLGVHLPPLRDRIVDLELLIDYFCMLQSNGDNTILKLEQDVMNVFQHYDWPGNVRELKQLVQNMCISLEELTVKSLDLPKKSNGTYHKTLQEIEVEHISNVLKKYNYQIRKSALVLGVDRNTLRKKIQKYDIQI